jgi:hypothetical protein
MNLGRGCNIDEWHDLAPTTYSVPSPMAIAIHGTFCQQTSGPLLSNKVTYCDEGLIKSFIEVSMLPELAFT